MQAQYDQTLMIQIADNNNELVSSASCHVFDDRTLNDTDLKQHVS